MRPQVVTANRSRLAESITACVVTGCTAPYLPKDTADQMGLPAWQAL